MADNSRIEWTDSTWNPIVGCSKTSEGCQHCYAERMAHRLGSNPTMKGRYAGLTNWAGQWTGEVRLLEEALDKPFSWKKPRRIFVGSMTDLFHKNVPDEWIYFVLAVVALNPRHTFIVLTKRAERMRHFMATNQRDLCERIQDQMAGLFKEQTAKQFNIRLVRYCDLIGASDLQASPELVLGEMPEIPWPLPNVWLGVTAENQARADERIPLLLETPAAVRFVSVEPMLGQVELRNNDRMVTVGLHEGHDWLTGEEWSHSSIFGGGPCWISGDDYGEKRLHWVICGSETGPNCRPMDEAWAVDLMVQCDAAGVPFFFKKQIVNGKALETIKGEVRREFPDAAQAGETRS